MQTIHLLFFIHDADKLQNFIKKKASHHSRKIACLFKDIHFAQKKSFFDDEGFGSNEIGAKHESELIPAVDEKGSHIRIGSIKEEKHQNEHDKLHEKRYLKVAPDIEQQIVKVRYEKHSQSERDTPKTVDGWLEGFVDDKDGSNGQSRKEGVEKFVVEIGAKEQPQKLALTPI